MRMSTASDTGRAVSDIIAFVLMFSIIITGVGLVSLGAFGNLTDFADREQVENSERGLTAMAATLDDIHRQNDTYRSELKLAVGGSSVSVIESELNITIIRNPGGPSSTPLPGYGPTDKFSLNSTEQRFDRDPEDVVVAYEGGGVFRRPGFGARYRPSMTCETQRGTNVAIISFVTLVSDDFRISKGTGSSTVLNQRGVPGESPVADLDSTLLFDAELAEQNSSYFASSSYRVLVNVSDTQNTAQWENYFNRTNSQWNASPNDSEFECRGSGGVDAVQVRQITVDLGI